MKFRSLFILLLIVTLILAPAAALELSPRSPEDEPAVAETTEKPAKTTKPPGDTAAAPTTSAQDTDGHRVKLLRRESGKIEELALEDYVTGALAAEMPASYPAEALKAQAAACRTNALYAREHPDASLGGADMSDYAGTHQGYLDEAERRRLWGDAFDENEKLCRDAVKATAGKILKYKDKTAFAAFHAISCGMTESAKNVWGNDLAYLRPVNSAGDILSPDYAKSVAVPLTEFNEKLAALDCEIRDGKIAVDKVTLTDSGYVSQVKLGGREIKGTKLRELFALPSAAFTLTLTQAGAVFECRGFGHGVGMSQFGARAMAQQGSGWEEILGHYYGGLVVVGEG